MKLKNLFAISIAAFALLGCTKEIIKEVPAETGKTFIKLELAPEGANIGGRAAHYDGTPSADELLIYNYAVFIFNQQGLLEAALTASPYSDEGGSNPNPQPDPYDYLNVTPLTFVYGYGSNKDYMDQSGIIQLSAGPKKFFALVNAPEELLSEQFEFVGNPALTEYQATGKTLDLENLMKVVGKYTSHGTPYHDTAIEDEGNRGFMMTTRIDDGGLFSISLPSMDDDSSPQEVRLNVGRAMAKVSVASILENVDDDKRPYGHLEVTSYKVVNNPKQMNVIASVTNSVLYTPYFNGGTSPNYVNTANYFESSGYIPVSEDNNISHTYAIENSNRTPRQGNSTAVFIEGKFRPISPYVVDADGNEVTIPQYTLNSPYTGDFYRMQEIATGLYDTSKYYNNEPDATLYNPNTHRVVKYEEGKCYYKFYLYDNTNAASPYTVKRNSYYKVDINAVNGAGEVDDNNLIDPQEPIDPQTYITVDIVVAPWYEINQGQGL